jgi:transposase
VQTRRLSPGWSPPSEVLTLGLTGRIWVCLQPQDGRKGIDGLAAVVTTHLGRDPLGGDLYVFRNSLGDRLKILAWQGDGFALYLRRLVRGTFAFPASAPCTRSSGRRRGES